MKRFPLSAVFLLALVSAAPSAVSQALSVDDLVKQGRKLNSEGKQEEAIAAFQKALATMPGSPEAHSGMGVALDLQGKYPEARVHLQKAIDLAKPENRQNALRALAMSYAFDCQTDKIIEYEKQVFDLRAEKPDPIGAAEIANELGRLLLECGKTDEAEKWYTRGHDSALTAAGLKPADRDLWEFRWEHAQARIAARRQQKEAAQKHLSAAKSLFEKGTLPDSQRPFLPYLAGYVAFYAGDYKTALDQFKQANQDDAFILALQAQTDEKLGDSAGAHELYAKIMNINAHNPPVAYARPLARTKLLIK